LRRAAPRDSRRAGRRALSAEESIDRAQREPAKDVESQRLVLEAVEHHVANVLVAVAAHQLEQQAGLADAPDAEHCEPARRALAQLLHALDQVAQLDGAVVKFAVGDRGAGAKHASSVRCRPGAGNLASWQLCQHQACCA